MLRTVVEQIFCRVIRNSACEPTDLLVGATWAATYSCEISRDMTEDTKPL
jgi:hypothetical protein